MAMAAAQEVPGAPVAIRSTTRRFEVPDMSSKGLWIMARLIKIYPHLSQQQLVGWLNGLVYSKEYMFLSQDHSVALAQLVQSYTLDPWPIVQERFVFCEDPASEEHQFEAAEFYSEFKRWAKSSSAKAIIVDENSDVPPAMIEKQLKIKLGTIEQKFAKVEA